MLAFFDPEQLKHEPKFSLFSGAPKPNSEVAERATVLREALQQQGHELKEPEPHGLIPVEAVHQPGLSAFPQKHLSALAGNPRGFRRSDSKYSS